VLKRHWPLMKLLLSFEIVLFCWDCTFISKMIASPKLTPPIPSSFQFSPKHFSLFPKKDTTSESTRFFRKVLCKLTKRYVQIHSDRHDKYKLRLQIEIGLMKPSRFCKLLVPLKYGTLENFDMLSKVYKKESRSSKVFKEYSFFGFFNKQWRVHWRLCSK